MSVRHCHGHPAVAGALLVGLLFTSCAESSNAGAGGALQSPTPPTTDSPTEDVSASIDAAKQRAAQQHARDVASGNEKSAPAAPDQGIFRSAEAPFATVDFRATSHWGGRVDGREYVVYAGEDGQPASVGEVIVDPYSVGSGQRPPTTFHTLSGVGALTIVGEHDGIVVLTDAVGAEHDFDVASGSFEN
jgi:hypothetical protein